MAVKANETCLNFNSYWCCNCYSCSSIAPYPPDVDCDDIGFSNFRVYQPDPHGLDADYDGIGCES